MHLNKVARPAKIGIWGFGIVGKSALNYFLEKGFDIEIIDKREFTQDEKLFLNKHQIKYFCQTDIENFLRRNDIILASPGIDLKKYSKYKNKFISELDIFFKSWQKQIIAVTGTLGKTSIVDLLSKILCKSGLKIKTGGNIGTGMLDLINIKDSYDYALLELSSFQLEQIKVVKGQFAPDLAIWTNFFDNHLDRHESTQAYFNAKLAILTNQKINQKALINWQLKDLLFCNLELNLPNRSFSFFYPEMDQNFNLAKLRNQDTLYYLENGNIVKLDMYGKKIICPIQKLPSISYLANWIIIAAAADILNISLDQIDLKDLSLPAHRLQHVATIDTVQYYNDSKSTLAQSTLAAVNQFKNLGQDHIHLFLGGISKGVDRLPLISEIAKKVKSIYCFGSESKFLYNQCIKGLAPQKNLNTYQFDSLEEAFKECIKNTQKNDIVLFSPSGASYDQFKNYEERGNYFISLVKDLENKK